MADFDPDAFLAEKPVASGFDPDAFLANHPEKNYGGLDLETGSDVAKSAGVGAVKGAIGAAGLAGDTRSLISRGISKAGEWAGLSPETVESVKESWRPSLAGAISDPLGTMLKAPFYYAPTSSDIRHEVEKHTGDLYEPKTVAGQYAQTAGEFLPSVIGGPESLAAKLVTRVAIPSVASETAGQATEGTALEPYARVGAALLGHRVGVGAKNAVAAGERAIPTIEELHDAANQGYNNARGYGVEIRRQPVARLADDMLSDLETDGFRGRNVPKTWDAIGELKNPAGQHVTIDDIESVRKALLRAGSNPLEGAEREASRRAVAAIDNYLSTLDPAEVAINPHYAGDVAREIGDARGNWAAMKRAEDIENRLENADLQAAATGSGANINNATRQKIKALLTSPKARRGFSAEELAQMERVVRGTFTGNVGRLLGKLAPTGVVSGSLGLEIGSHLIGGPTGVGAIPVLGAVAKRIGDASTARQSRILDEMVRSRSPLAAQAPAPPAPTRVSPLSAGLVGAQAAESTERAAGGRVEAKNIDHAPTEAQKKAGNYAKDHVRLHGLDITIENAKGAARSGVGRDGKPWSVKMPAHYGYIKGTVGRDKDHVDVYLGPHAKSPHVFVVHQMDAETGKFDEHKAFLGFASREQARKTYIAGFSDGKGHQRLGHMAEMSIDAFKEWLEDGDTTKPVAGAVAFKAGSLIGLAQNVAGVHFQCRTCKYMDKVKGLCMNKMPELYGRHVEPEYCCNLYDRRGMRVIV